MPKEKNKPYYDVAGPLERSVMVLRGDALKQDEYAAFCTNVNLAIAKAKESLSQVIAKLKRVSVFNVPYVSIKQNDCTNRHEVFLQKYMQSNEGENVRVLVYIGQERIVINDDGSFNISHVVETDFNNEQGWHPAEGIVNAKVCFEECNRIKYLIEDVLLDVAFCHCLPCFSDTSDLEFRREFSMQKVAFAKERFETTVHGNMHEGITYISFASLVRMKNGEFDVDAYIALWNEFLDHYRYDTAMKDKIARKAAGIVKIEFKGTDDLVYKLYSKHKKYKQLPLNKIRQELDALPQGKYLLVRLERKPRKQDVKSTLLNYFGGEELHVGRIKISPYEQLIMLENWDTYLGMYYFEL